MTYLAPDTVQLVTQNFDVKIMAAVSLSAAREALRALAASEEIFDWPRDGTQELVSQVMERLEQLESSLKDGNSS